MNAGTSGRTGTGLQPQERRWEFAWHLAPAVPPLEPFAVEVPEPPAGTRRPAAVMFDIGLTLIHPSGTVMLADARGEVPGFDAPPHDLAAALLLAAEARHLPLPRGLDGDGKVCVTWGMLLGLGPDEAARVWRRMMARQDLYCELDPEAEEVLAGCTARDQGGRRLQLRRHAGSRAAPLRARPVLRRRRRLHCGRGGETGPGDLPGGSGRAVGAGDARWFVGDGLVNDVLGARRAGVALGVLYDRFGVHTRLPEVPGSAGSPNCWAGWTSWTSRTRTSRPEDTQGDGAVAVRHTARRIPAIGRAAINGQEAQVQQHDEKWLAYFVREGYPAVEPLGSGMEGAVYHLADGLVAKVWGDRSARSSTGWAASTPTSTRLGRRSRRRCSTRSVRRSARR